jgi:hypothetical protein
MKAVNQPAIATPRLARTGILEKLETDKERGRGDASGEF